MKICANICSVITAIIDIRAGNPIPLLYSVCIKSIEVIKHPEFIKWHAEVREKVPQLPYICLIMLHKVLSQFASFSTNTGNNSLIEHESDGSNLKVDLVVKIVKFIMRSSPTSITTSWKARSLTPSQTSPLAMQTPKS